MGGDVGDEGCAQRPGLSSEEQVHRTDRNARFLQGMSNGPVMLSASSGVEIPSLERCQRLAHATDLPGIVAAILRAVFQFGDGDGRQADSIPRSLPLATSSLDPARDPVALAFALILGRGQFHAAQQEDKHVGIQKR